MRIGDILFKFDLTYLLGRARRQVAGRIGNATLSLTFVTSSVTPKDRERGLARGRPSLARSPGPVCMGML